MKISIAMCTYNGARFLREQLDSIASQTRLPDELVVCDDGSTDTTLALLTEYANTVKFPVRIRCNTSRLGAARNFEQAISLVQGDIIALSDQDDVWRHDKLQILEQVLSENPTAGYLFSDAIVINETGKIISNSLWKKVPFNSRQRTRFSRSPVDQVRVLLKSSVVTGATMAFRASLKTVIFPMLELWIHDAWISFASSINGVPGIPIQKPLIYYRKHQAQAIGIPLPGPLGLLTKVLHFLNDPRAYNFYEFESHKWNTSYALFKNVASQTPIVLQLLEAKVAHVALRARLSHWPRTTRLAVIAVELTHGRYHLYSGGWISAMKDFLLPVVNDSYAV
jgi:glycosyltransferase involved in cell wall biosynthesis